MGQPGWPFWPEVVRSVGGLGSRWGTGRAQAVTDRHCRPGGSLVRTAQKVLSQELPTHLSHFPSAPHAEGPPAHPSGSPPSDLRAGLSQVALSLLPALGGSCQLPTPEVQDQCILATSACPAAPPASPFPAQPVPPQTAAARFGKC